MTEKKYYLTNDHKRTTKEKADLMVVIDGDTEAWVRLKK